MLMINLTTLKSFIDERDSFIIKGRRNLDLKLNVNSDLDTNNKDKPQYISQNIEKVVTDSFGMTTSGIQEKSLHYGMSLTTSPISAYNVSATALVTLQERIHSYSSIQTDERKLNTSTRIINESTLRNSVPRNYEVGSLIAPQMSATLHTPEVKATLHTPEVIVTSNSENFTVITQANSNIQGKPLIFFTYGPA